MLTRFRVRGFKNLVDTDLHFGPLTCIAGSNGAGKSNVFDAIRFLSELADKPFVEASREIRGGDDLRGLWSRQKPGRMDFLAEMLIPKSGEDDFGQPAIASATFVKYELALVLEEDPDHPAGERIRLDYEHLTYIPKSKYKEHLFFPYSRDWIESVAVSTKRTTSFISTEHSSGRGNVVRLQSDRMRQEEKKQQGGGKASGFSADKLPRTVLSSAQTADEQRTAVLVRQEMRSWKQFQLEPSFLRQADSFQSPLSIDPTGAHVPAALWRLSQDKSLGGAETVYSMVANTLSRLVEKIRSVRIDRDEVRRALRFMLMDRAGLELPASSLSDGTMRFVALAVLDLDPDQKGIVCLEEPENGIHPQRVPAILDLLYRIAVDTELPCGIGNPLRQVIVTTHSPLVSAKVKTGDLLFAQSIHYTDSGERILGVDFLGLPGSWRAKSGPETTISRGKVLAYLKGVSVVPIDIQGPSVADSFGEQMQLPL
ncbi:AAA family ATPase [Tahibacter harae]|uniref:AAA family ATPase n=1 Tax=Tahibacter harae TaxID=2963937 RepID=A0ABT1QYN3_9GAMM|nr:ATP-binding protein [Tahibacter harae]MCQ4167397.1 AAA family ATPase [Tahibacter harae]